jgi:hypothetical protein
MYWSYYHDDEDSNDYCLDRNDQPTCGEDGFLVKACGAQVPVTKSDGQNGLPTNCSHGE